MEALMRRAGDWTFGEVLTAVARVLSRAGGQQEVAATRAFVQLFGNPKELADIASEYDAAQLSYHIGLLLVASLLSPRAWTLLAIELGGDEEMRAGSRDCPPHASHRLYALLKDMLLHRRSTHTFTFAEAASFADMWLGV